MTDIIDQANDVAQQSIERAIANAPKSTFKNGVFNFEIDGYAVELYKEGNLWLDKIYTLFGHVINRVSSEKSIKFSEVVDAIKEDIQKSKQIEQTIFKN